MNWMTIGIICLVVAMVVGPVMIMQPSKRQRNLAALRTQAAKMGMRVQMDKIREETLAGYGKPWPIGDKSKRQIVPWRLEKMPYAHGLHIAEYWHVEAQQALPEGLAAVLPDLLGRLPEGVKAVEVNATGARCYWTERGGEQALQALSQWLDTFITATVPFIRHRPNV